MALMQPPTPPDHSYFIDFWRLVPGSRGAVFDLLTEPGRLVALGCGAPRDVQEQTGFILDHEASGGWFTFSVGEGGEAGTPVEVRFYAESLQPRSALDAIARAMGFHLSTIVAAARGGPGPDPAAWAADRLAPDPAPRVVRWADLRWRSHRYTDSAESIGESAPLTGLLAARHVAADVHRLYPGQRSCRHHAETLEEEAFFVFRGRCKMSIEDQTHDLGPGDFALTLPGDAHFLWNDSDEPCEILMFGTTNMPDNDCVYPFGRDGAWRERTGETVAP
ncbi:MAG: cupin domain-containing protein [Candidatus Sericytochromatia bacterium]|nr:cupin domain-containing protein [Candidatus Tanganyikabacteria bacterium]